MPLVVPLVLASAVSLVVSLASSLAVSLVVPLDVSPGSLVAWLSSCWFALMLLGSVGECFSCTLFP